MKGFYDNRQNISDSSDAPKVFVIEHGDAIQKESTARCIPCHEGMVCNRPGVTLRKVHSKRGYWRTSEESSMMYVCADVDAPDANKETSKFCPGGNITSMCGEGRSICSVHTSRNQSCLAAYPSLTEKQLNAHCNLIYEKSDCNGDMKYNLNGIDSCCQWQSIAPLCSRCGPFTKYTKSNDLPGECFKCPDPSDPGLEANRRNIQALANLLLGGIPMLFFFIFLFMLTRAGMVFKMIDSDDSGYIEVDELIFAVRHYAGFTKEKISDNRIKKIFIVFDPDGNGKIEEAIFTSLWQHIHAEVFHPTEKKKVFKRASICILHLVKKTKDEKKKEIRKEHVEHLDDKAFTEYINSDTVEVKEKNLVHHAKQFKTSGGKKKYSLFKAKMNKVKFARNMVSDMMVGAALDVDTKAIKEGIADITDNTAEIQETDEFQEIKDETATEGAGEIEVVPDIDTSGAQVNFDTSGVVGNVGDVVGADIDGDGIQKGIDGMKAGINKAKDGAAKGMELAKDGAPKGLELAKDGAKIGGELAGKGLDMANKMAPKELKDAGNKVAAGFSKQANQLDLDVPDAVKIHKIPKLGPTFKIIFGWGQIMSSFNVTFKIQWPDSFDRLMDGMYAPFNLDITQFFGPVGCLENTNYLNTFRYMMGTFALLISLLIGAAFFAFLMKKFCPNKIFQPKYDMKTVRANMFRLLNSIVFMMYPGLSLRVFRAFASKTYGKITYLAADMSIRIIPESPEYTTLLYYAWLFMFLYVFCIPVAIGAILYTHRQAIAHDPDDQDEHIDPNWHSEVIKVRKEFGSIYGDYRRKYYFWEIIEMVRKVVLIGALVMIPIDSLQIFFGVIICFVYSFMAALMEPFNDPADQNLQFITSLQLFLTLATGFYISYRAFEVAASGMDTDQARANDMFIEPLLMLLSSAVFLCIFFVIYITFKELCINTVVNNVKSLLEARKKKIQKEKTQKDLLKSLQGGEQVDGKSKYVVAPDKDKEYKLPDA